MKQSIVTLKTYFEAGDRPTQAQFEDLIDSFHHKDSGELLTSFSISPEGDVTFNFSDNSSVTIESFVLPSVVKTLSNGLTKDGNENGKLGGTLIENTSIDIDTFLLSFIAGLTQIAIDQNTISLNAAQLIELISAFDLRLTSDNININGSSVIDIITDNLNMSVNAASLTATDSIEIGANETDIAATTRLTIQPPNHDTAVQGEVLTKDPNGNTIWAPVAAYVPKFVITYKGASYIAKSATTRVNITGVLMDAINTVALVGATDSTGVSATIVNATYDTLTVDLVANNTSQDYTLTLSNSAKSQDVTYQSDSFNTYVPSLSGSGKNLWVRPVIAGNDCTVSDGAFACEDSEGDGWYEHAYFGDFSTTNKLVFNFRLAKINGVSPAYFMLRLDDSNARSTTGNPRLYWNGNILTIYAPDSTILINNHQSFINETITVEYTPTNFAVYTNGVLIDELAGTYDLSSIYFTVTAYRAMIIDNIEVKEF